MYDVDTSNPAYRHGHAGRRRFSSTYQSWASMIQRATNPRRPCAHCYVLNGVTVCDRWRTFENFLADMGERPAGTSLDRVDNSKGYYPENCRWATTAQQANNKSSSRLVTLHGKTQSVTAWCQELGLSRNTVWARINQYGYTPEEALTKPKQDRIASVRAMTAARLNGRRGNGNDS